MSLLNTIQADLLDDTSEFSSILLKARVLAHQVQSPELRRWVLSELDGYSKSDTHPDYRQFDLPLMGTFSGPFESKMERVTIPTSTLPESVQNFINPMVISEGVGALNELLASNEQEFRRFLPVEFTLLARDRVQMTGGMLLAESYQSIPRHLITGVLNNVKTRLLDFVLDLQDKSSGSADSAVASPNADVVRNLVNINIYGNNNIVAGGEKIVQQVTPVDKGNIDSLLDHLRNFDIDEQDLERLKHAVSNEPEATSNGFGSNVSSWFGDMVSKAASGAWQVGLSAAPSILTSALNNFYGI